MANPAFTSDAQKRAKVIITVDPTSTGVNWAVSVQDNNTSYGGYSTSAGNLVVKIDGLSVFTASNKSYDFGSGVISNPYFPDIFSGVKTLSAGSHTISATFSGDGTTVGTATASTTFSVVGTTTYKVSFNSNGGSISPSPITNLANGALPGNFPSPGTKSGYSFDGWNGSYQAGTAIPAISGSDVLYTAQWTSTGGGSTFSYGYDVNGGSTVYPTAQSPDTVAAGTVITLATTSKEGYTLSGWYTDSGLSSRAGSAGSSYTINANRTFYAKWVSSSSGIPVWPSPLPTLSQFIAGQSYSDSITASNMADGTYSISSGSLPGGISINSATGALSGTVTTASDYSFTVSAQNSSGTATQSYSGTIKGIMRVRQNDAWVKVVAKKREGEIWKPGTVRVWANSTWLYGS